MSKLVHAPGDQLTSELREASALDRGVYAAQESLISHGCPTQQQGAASSVTDGSGCCSSSQTRATTIWQGPFPSADGEPPWLLVDLGSVQNLGSVVIGWDLKFVPGQGLVPALHHHQEQEQEQEQQQQQQPADGGSGGDGGGGGGGSDKDDADWSADDNDLSDASHESGSVTSSTAATAAATAAAAKPVVCEYVLSTSVMNPGARRFVDITRHRVEDRAATGPWDHIQLPPDCKGRYLRVRTSC